MNSKNKVKRPFPPIPTETTLKKYGLYDFLFVAILVGQDGKCAICKKVPNGHWCIDHEHVKGYKKLPEEKKWVYVRGITCWFCNRYYLARGVTVQKVEAVKEYLLAYEKRKNQFLRAEGE